jgi:excisionase family DNA binding protein
LSDQTTEQEHLWTSSDVARRMTVKESWVRDHVSREKPIIPHVKVGKLVRFRRRDIEEFITSMIVTQPTWDRTEVALGAY